MCIIMLSFSPTPMETSSPRCAHTGGRSSYANSSKPQLPDSSCILMQARRICHQVAASPGVV